MTNGSLWHRFKLTLRLSFALAKTNFKLRNEGSYLGVVWYLLGPLALFFIILVVRGTAFSDASIPSYPIYLLIGITGFNFFRQSVTTSIRAITSNSEFIKSINNVSLATFPMATIMEAAFSHVFEIILVAAFMIWFGVPVAGILLYPISFLIFLPFVLGVGFFCAAVGVFTMDLDNIWNIVSQLLIFATPVFYAVTPGSPLYTANLLNPLFYFITISRDLLISHTFPPAWMVAVLLGAGGLTCLIGIKVFEAKKRKFAEKI